MLKKIFYPLSRVLALGAGLLFYTELAFSAVLLPSGDTLLNGDFNDINYGATGTAFLTTFLYTSELAVTESPSTTASTTDLSFNYNIDNLGSPLATITYTLSNNGVSNFTDLRFIVNVQPDGSNTFNDNVSLLWGAPSAGDPDAYQLADFGDTLSLDFISNNGLNNSDSCGGTCDADFALQWNIAQSNPGDIYQIVIGLSDNGQTISNRFLEASSVDTSNTVLTFSGNVSIVPLPPAILLFGFGISIFGFFVKRRKN